jgi:hypothetical protein
MAYGSKENVVFDHTSVLKTILKRFCPATTKMTARVTAANDLEVLLTETKPRTDCTAAPDMPFKIAFDDRFMMLPAAAKKGARPKQAARLVRRKPSELEQSMQTLADKAIAKGVPPDKL